MERDHKSIVAERVWIQTSKFKSRYTLFYRVSTNTALRRYVILNAATAHEILRLIISWFNEPERFDLFIRSKLDQIERGGRE